jgi:hypothetical protein
MEQKFSIGIVVALVMQTSGGAYWLSRQVSAIEANQVAISELSVRVNEGTMVNMQRDTAQLTTRVNANSEKLGQLESEIGISPTYDTTDAIIEAVNRLNSKFESFVDAVEDVVEDELDIELEYEDDDRWNRN